MASETFERGRAAGFAAAHAEFARLTLAVHADGLEALSARLAATPEAVAAVHEATAVLRDAASRHDPARIDDNGVEVDVDASPLEDADGSA